MASVAAAWVAVAWAAAVAAVPKASAAVMGGMSGGMGGGMMGGGFMNVKPEKVEKFKLTTVCLEHGKSEPRAAIPYKIVPIEQFTAKPEVHQLCKMLGHNKMPPASRTGRRMGPQ